jgi:hypothetical protein
MDYMTAGGEAILAAFRELLAWMDDSWLPLSKNARVRSYIARLIQERF